MKHIVPIIVLALTLSACTWVKLTPGGEKIRAMSADEVQSCTKKGTTEVSLKADIAGIDRNSEKVRKELETLARNSAAGSKGDTVVPASEIENGTQTFNIYRCINP